VIKKYGHDMLFFLKNINCYFVVVYLHKSFCRILVVFIISAAEEGKLPFPTASDLNTRFRRIITGYQRTHKQGMLKLEQISKVC